MRHSQGARASVPAATQLTRGPRQPTMARALPPHMLVCATLSLALVWAASVSGASHSNGAAPGMTITADVDVSAALRETSDRWLSVNIDGSQMVGFPYSDPILRVMAQELGGRSYLRVGGTTSDTAFYAMSGAAPTTPPPGYKIVVTAATVDNLCGFAAGAGMKVIFGINAGKGPRNNSATGAWDPSNAKTLLEYVHTNHPGCVEGWELGNEPNLWLFNFGLIISTQQLVDDYRTVKGVMAQINPDWLLIGNDVAFQIPLVGELFPTYTDWMSGGAGSLVDVITWHWYPLEGPGCPLGGFPVAATPQRVITPHTLNMDAPSRSTVLQYAAKYGSNTTRVWLGEMAAASCGGADNVTNAWSGAFYYLDMLGSLGVDGHDAVMRQSLWSDHYGLIDDNGSHFANPDYWSAVLWTRLMDGRVVSVAITPTVVPESSLYRVYARCTLNAKSRGNSSKALFPDAAGGVTVLVLNLAPTSALTVTGFGSLSTSSSQRHEFVGTSGATSSTLDDVLTSHYVRLNDGAPLVRGATGATPPLAAKAVAAGDALVLPPLSYAFVVFDKAAAAACA